MKRLKRKRKEIRRKQREYKKEKNTLILIGLIAGFIFGILLQTDLFHSDDYSTINKESAEVLFPEIPKVYFTGFNRLYIENENPLLFEGSLNLVKKYHYGYYYNGTNNIHLFIDDRLNRFRDNFYHEMGHHIFDNLLSEKERKEWKLIYEKTNENDFITGYASTDYQEDFAVNMEFYFNSQTYYIRCYFGYCSDSIYKKISKERLKFIVEKIVMIYEPEKIDEVLKTIYHETFIL